MSSGLDCCQQPEGFMFIKGEPLDNPYGIPRTPQWMCNSMVVAKTEGDNSGCFLSPSPYQFDIKPIFDTNLSPSPVQPHQHSPHYLLQSRLLKRNSSEDSEFDYVVLFQSDSLFHALDLCALIPSSDFLSHTPPKHSSLSKGYSVLSSAPPDSVKQLLQSDLSFFNSVHSPAPPDS